MADYSDIRYVFTGVTEYATVDNLPTSGNSTGDQALVTGTNRLYIWNGSGWYNIALINTTPSISGASSAYTLASDGTATTVTITATDPEGLPIIYSIASDTSGSIATVSQGTGSNTNVFTITPSTNTANAGTFSLTFRASDGVNIATAVSSFTLRFSVQNSNYTTALITSVGGNNAVNNSFDDASTNNHTITANGNVTQNTFSPYRHGGYSTYFDGNGDYLVASDHASFDMSNGDFTVEFWMHADTQSLNYPAIISSSNYNSAGSTSVRFDNTGQTNKLYVYCNSASPSADPLLTSSALSLNEWHHVALVRNGTSLKFYVDGSEDGSVTIGSSQTFDFSVGELRIGRGFDVDSTNGYFKGYLIDIRLVKGTAVYTSAFTPPTERLTAITNTSLLTCHLPYIADGSTNSHSITVNGNTKTEPFSPYDHNGYSTGSNGGSMYFDGSGDYLVTGADADQFVNSGNIGTIEMWLRLDAFSSPRTSLCGQWTSTGGYAGWTFDLDTSGQLVIGVNGNINSAKTTGLTLGNWHHFAIVNTGSAINIFTDGIYKSTSTNASVTSASSSSLTVGSRSDNSLPTNGIIADFRFVDGTVVYDRGSASIGDKVFTPPTAPLTAITNTSLLLKGTDAGIIDKSQSVKTITLNGDVKSSTTQSKYLTSSMYFDGTGDYIAASLGDDIAAFGTADFTVEGWFYIESGDEYPFVLDFRSAPTQAAGVLYFFNYGNGAVDWYVNGTSQQLGTSAGVDTWQHIAVCRSGTTTKMFINGTQSGSVTDTYNYVAASTVYIGQRYTAERRFKGYLSDVRITKGLARYTSNFTAPTAALQG